MKPSSEFSNFNTAMDTILRADPKAVKEAMEREKQDNAARRTNAHIGFDDSLLRSQLRELWTELELHFPHQFSHDLVGALAHLSADIVIGKQPTTLRAGRGKKIVISCSFGGRYDDLLAAARTGELSRVTHAFDFLRSLSSLDHASGDRGA
jgi:hypothetical protein